MCVCVSVRWTTAAVRRWCTEILTDERNIGIRWRWCSCTAGNSCGRTGRQAAIIFRLMLFHFLIKKKSVSVQMRERRRNTDAYSAAAQLKKLLRKLIWTKWENELERWKDCRLWMTSNLTIWLHRRDYCYISILHSSAIINFYGFIQWISHLMLMKICKYIQYWLNTSNNEALPCFGRKWQHILYSYIASANKGLWLCKCIEFSRILLQIRAHQLALNTWAASSHTHNSDRPATNIQFQLHPALASNIRR